jgi:hypothetical protein
LGGASFFAIAACLLQGRKAFLALGGVGICLALGAINGTAIVSPYFSMGPMAAFLATTPVDSAIVFDGDIDTGSSLLFYSDRKIILLDQKPEKDFVVRRYGVGRDRYLTSEELISRWSGEAPLLFVTEKARLSEWQTRFGSPNLSPSGGSGTQIILKNFP